METITVRGKIEFCEQENKEFSRGFTATLQNSPAFAYGNQTCVIIEYSIMANGRLCEPDYIDTRYDPTIKSNKEDFKMWLRQYFYTHLCQHKLTFCPN